MKPYWQSDNGETRLTLYCGDALEVLRTLPDESVHCSVTSPPYGKLINYNTGGRGDYGPNSTPGPDEYADWFLPVAGEIERVLVLGGVFALNLNGQGDSTYPEEVAHRIRRETGFVLHERVAWVKSNAIPVGHRGSHLIPEWDPIWVFRRGESLAHFGRDDIRRPYSDVTMRRARNGNLHRSQRGNHAGQARPYVRGEKPEYMNPLGRDAPNVIWAAPEQSTLWPHPARFPEELPEFFILAYCPVGGTVLDPFAGSGTTLLVAQRLGRNGIGIDLSQEYCAMAKRRLEKVHTQQRLPV